MTESTTPSPDLYDAVVAVASPHLIDANGWGVSADLDVPGQLLVERFEDPNPNMVDVYDRNPLTPDQARKFGTALHRSAATIEGHDPDGYCPHCGRGDVGPSPEQYEEMRQRTADLDQKHQAILEAAHLWRDRPSGDVGLAIALGGILDATDHTVPPATAALLRVLKELDRLERNARHDGGDDALEILRIASRLREVADTTPKES